MEPSTWEMVWYVVFVVSSLMFYGTVAVVAMKGVGDVVAMIRRMIDGRRESS